MAVGNIVLELDTPPLPAGATETPKEYFEKIKEVVAAYLPTNGLDDARRRWVRRYDIPEDIAGTVTYLEGLLASTSIDFTTHEVVHLPPPGTGVLYCVLGEIVDCYGTFRVVNKSAPHGPALLANVPLNGGLSVDVELRFVVTFGEPFPE